MDYGESVITIYESVNFTFKVSNIILGQWLVNTVNSYLHQGTFSSLQI